MHRMRMIVAAVSALAFATPLAAQEPPSGAAQIQARLDAAVASGALTRREAGTFRESVRQLANLERDFGRGGLNERETAILRQRTGSLNRDISILEGGRGS